MISEEQIHERMTAAAEAGCKTASFRAVVRHVVWDKDEADEVDAYAEKAHRVADGIRAEIEAAGYQVVGTYLRPPIVEVNVKVPSSPPPSPSGGSDL